MAVSRMRKIQILAHLGAKDRITAALREGGALHVVEPSIDLGHESDDEARRERERDLRDRLGKLEHLRGFRQSRAPKTKRSLDAMLNPKVAVDESDLTRIVSEFDTDGHYRRCVDLEGRARSAEAGGTTSHAAGSALATRLGAKL